MWLWWTISMIIVCGCIIYAMYILMSSRKLQKLISSGVPPKNISKNKLSTAKEFIVQHQPKGSSNINQQSAENPYLSKINELQQRLQLLEYEVSLKKNPVKLREDETDWEELYHSVNTAKLKLEDDLYYANETLQSTESKLAHLIQNERDVVETQSLLEAKLNEAHSLQNKIGELQQRLEGAYNREKELEEELYDSKNLMGEYQILQQQYAHSLSETDELRNRLQELNSRNSLLQQKLARLSELESNLETFEYEKTEIKNTVEEIITENTTLSLKLQELQDKLNSEKYAGEG